MTTTIKLLTFLNHTTLARGLETFLWYSNSMLDGHIQPWKFDISDVVQEEWRSSRNRGKVSRGLENCRTAEWSVESLSANTKHSRLPLLCGFPSPFSLTLNNVITEITYHHAKV